MIDAIPLGAPMETENEQKNRITPPPSDRLSTWCKYNIFAKYCDSLSIADKRQIFGVIRNKLTGKDVTSVYNHYLPRFGVTLGEFALFHTIGEHIRRNGMTRK